MKRLLLLPALNAVLAGCTVTPPENAIDTYGHAVASKYRAWVRSADYAAWVATQPTPPPRFGYSQDCRVFSKLAVPAEVKSCRQGPGPADGPTITLELSDGRWLMFDA